jgi:hypothetical protein
MAGATGLQLMAWLQPVDVDPQRYGYGDRRFGHRLCIDGGLVSTQAKQRAAAQA